MPRQRPAAATEPPAATNPPPAETTPTATSGPSPASPLRAWFSRPYLYLDAGSLSGRRLRRRGNPARGSCSRSCLRCRSEEHTSELQSLRHLVCRLLLEKK